MSKKRGVKLPLTLPRRWIGDLMAISEGIPRVAMDRRLKLPRLALARRSAAECPSWLVLFIKAYAVVSNRIPSLRRAYVKFPFPHLYEADENIASVSVARDYLGEPAVFFGRLSAPENQSLRQLSDHVTSWKNLPVEQIPPFERLVRYSRYPLPIRRFMWRLGMNLSGWHRAKTFGTFGVTALGNSGCRILHLLAPTATNLSFGPVTETGDVEMQLTFDHRVLDGMSAVRVLAELEEVLNGAMADELQSQVSRHHAA